MPLFVIFFRHDKMNQTAIYKEVWQDEQFAELSKEAKLFALYCFTNRNLSLIPIYKLTNREIMFDLGITQESVKKLKQEVEGFGIFFSGSYCIIKSPLKPFTFKGEKLELAIKNKIEEIPENIVRMAQSDRVSIEYRESIDTSNSNNNSNKNNTNNSNIDTSIEKKEEKVEVRFINKFNEITNRKFKVTDNVTKSLNARLKEGYTTKDIATAILNASEDEYLGGDGQKYLTPEYILRRDKLERWINAS